MREWVRLIAPVAVIASAASPVYAAASLTLEEAQKLAFPEAERFDEAHVVFRPPDVEAIQKISGQKVRTRGQQVSKAQLGSQTIGFFIIDYVIGKHRVIDYAVALDAIGRICRVELIEYRESYGGEIHSPDWLAQFVGKSS